MREGLAFECLEEDIDAFLEYPAIGVLVYKRRAERLDLAGMIAATRAKNDPTASQDVRHRIVFRETQRMPHRHDVEAAADFEMLGDATEVHRHHEDVWDQLSAFRLEVVLSHPERVVIALIHAL